MVMGILWNLGNRIFRGVGHRVRRERWLCRQVGLKNFDSYRAMQMSDMPEIDISIVQGIRLNSEALRSCRVSRWLVLCSD